MPAPPQAAYSFMANPRSSLQVHPLLVDVIVLGSTATAEGTRVAATFVDALRVCGLTMKMPVAAHFFLPAREPLVLYAHGSSLGLVTVEHRFDFLEGDGGTSLVRQAVFIDAKILRGYTVRTARAAHEEALHRTAEALSRSSTPPTVAAIAAAYRSGAPIPPADVLHLSGRVCRGVDESNFETLHPDGLLVKPFSWVVGDDGVAMLLDSTSSLVERFHRLGFKDEWIRAKLAAGEHFRLALFPRAEATAATWDGIFQLVEQHFAPSIARKVTRHAAALRTTPFETIQASAAR
eukprot:3025720-Prymnesium_polylepis.1